LKHLPASAKKKPDDLCKLTDVTLPFLQANRTGNRICAWLTPYETRSDKAFFGRTAFLMSLSVGRNTLKRRI
jgi:hypothetical protein